jgi:hypothetical protein
MLRDPRAQAFVGDFTDGWLGLYKLGQLSKHREIATCNECHRKMDPLGFAMESFDAIGGLETVSGMNNR